MKELAEKEQWQTEIAGGKLFNFRPFFFVAVFLCAGIAFGYFHIVRGYSKWWAAGLLSTTFLPFFTCRSFARAKRTLFAVLALCTAFLIGFTLFSAKAKAFEKGGVYDGEHVVIGRVIARSKTDGGGRLQLGDLYIDGTEERGEMTVYLSETEMKNVQLSDELVLRGEVSTQEGWFTKYGFAADAVGGGTRYYAWADEVVVTGHTFDLFLAVRQRIEQVTYAGMDETPAATTMAVLTGDTTGIESGLLENIRYGGIAHIFAVSGLHIGALFAFCTLLMKKTALRRASKPVRFLLTAVILIFYGGVCGFSDSVVRAIVMCLSLYAANLIGIGSDSLENIGLAAIVVLFISPISLFKVGFQLSFTACLGIVLLARPFQKATYAVGRGVAGIFGWQAKPLEETEDVPPSVAQRITRSVVSFLSVTMAAQIFTSPILLRSFGYLSGWSLFFNCLFVPLISATFAILLLFVAVACLLPASISVYVLFVPNAIWSALLLLFQALDLSKFALSGITISAGAFVCYYLALTFLTDKWNVGRGVKTFLFFVCITGFMTNILLINAQSLAFF